MAERCPDVTPIADDIFGEFADVLYKQLLTNTEYLNKLKGLVAQKEVQTRFGKEDEQTHRKSETIVMTETNDRRVEGILKTLQTTNIEIVALVVKLRRDSASSGFSSGIDISDLITCIQDQQPHDTTPEMIPMRPSSEYFIERQGTASQTPRRRRGGNTRQEVEEEPNTSPSKDCQ